MDVSANLAAPLVRYVCLWIHRFMIVTCRWANTARVLPKSQRNGHGIDVEPVPPSALVSFAINFAVVDAAQRNGELIRYLTAQRARLREPETVRFAGSVCALVEDVE